MLRTRKPLAKVGKRGKELLAIRDKVWPQILWRAGYACEGCQKPASQVALELAHAFGRNGTGGGLGDFAHVKELGLALCRRCHQLYDGYLSAELRVRLERLALSRFVKAYAVTIDPAASNLENIRTAVRQLETAGATPDVGAGGG